MKTQELKPIGEKQDYYEELEKALTEYFREYIYLPLLKTIKAKPKVINSYDDLVQLIRSGKITYVKGRFQGKITSQTSKALKGLGATWDKKQGKWALPRSKLTSDITTAIAASESSFIEMTQRVDKQLENLSVPLPAFEKLFSKSIYKVSRDFQTNVQSISIKLKETEALKSLMSQKYLDTKDLPIKAKRYNERMGEYVKEWTDNEIKKLRESMKEHTYAGNRYEDVIDTIRKSYSVSQNKAAFLARQETNLIISNITQERYQSAGVNTYKWRTIGDSKVRDTHKKLNNTTHTWDNPPLVSEPGEPARYAHPLQDYNCRCQAVPVVKF